jgi:hypothetical protein
MRWTRTLPLAYEQLSLIISAERPPGLSSMLPDERHSLAGLGRARVLHVPGADADDMLVTAAIWCWPSPM